MNWDMFDSVVAVVLLSGAATLATIVIRKTKNTAYRAAASVALLAAFLLIWINGAVGIIGSEDNDANVMYFALLAIAVIGAFIARFRPRGLERTMYVTAAGQALIAELALMHNLGVDGPIWPRDILMLTALFIVLWLISAFFFRKAARTTSVENAV